MKLQGKVALVTGSAQGIGRAIALALATEGADVAVVDLNLEKAQSTAREIEQRGVRAAALQVDVSDGASVERMFQQAVEQLGRVDILVNNAGMGSPSRGLELSERDWERVIGVNLKGMFLCCKAAVPPMMERGWGRVVNIASASAFHGSFIGDLGYSSSKAGVLGLTRGLARLVAPRGVTVNAIAPGPIDAGIAKLAGRRTPEELQDQVTKTVPMGRLGQPEEVAQVAVFLASEGSSFVTGVTIVAGGGCIMH